MRLASLILFALAMAGGGARAAGPAAPDVTPFTLLDQGGVVVAAYLDDAGPFPLLLDTGSSHSVLSEELAQRLHLTTVAATTLSSTVGEVRRAVVRLDRLSLGPVRVTDLLPTVIPTASFGATGAVLGVIGQDVLSACRFTIDYRQRHIVWHGPTDLPAPDANALALDFEQGRYLARLPQRHSVLRLVPDSGSGGLVLIDGPGLAPLSLDDAAGETLVESLAGRQPGRAVTVRTLQVGGLLLRDLPAVVVPATSTPGPAGDGLLPLHVFERATFEGPEGRLRLDRWAPSRR